MLESLGYSVLPAITPQEGISLVCKSDNQIDLVLTDIIMPEMNGRDLAERLMKIQPGMKCLYMSGYSADIISLQGLLYKNVHFIEKPFSKIELASKVRSTLDDQFIL